MYSTNQMTFRKYRAGFSLGLQDAALAKKTIIGALRSL